MKRLLSILIIIVLINSVPVSSGLIAQGGIESGENAPGFELKTADGETLALKDFTGKVVILHFWHAN